MRSSRQEPIAESCAQKTSTMHTNQSGQNRGKNISTVSTEIR